MSTPSDDGETSPAPVVERSEEHEQPKASHDDSDNAADTERVKQDDTVDDKVPETGHDDQQHDLAADEHEERTYTHEMTEKQSAEQEGVQPVVHSDNQTSTLEGQNGYSLHSNDAGQNDSTENDIDESVEETEDVGIGGNQQSAESSAENVTIEQESAPGDSVAQNDSAEEENGAHSEANEGESDTKHYDSTTRYKTEDDNLEGTEDETLENNENEDAPGDIHDSKTGTTTSAVDDHTNESLHFDSICESDKTKEQATKGRLDEANNTQALTLDYRGNAASENQGQNEAVSDERRNLTGHQHSDNLGSAALTGHEEGRTSCNSFNGNEDEGLKYEENVEDNTGDEIMGTAQIDINADNNTSQATGPFSQADQGSTDKLANTGGQNAVESEEDTTLQDEELQAEARSDSKSEENHVDNSEQDRGFLYPPPQGKSHAHETEASTDHQASVGHQADNGTSAQSTMNKTAAQEMKVLQPNDRITDGHYRGSAPEEDTETKGQDSTSFGTRTTLNREKNSTGSKPVPESSVARLSHTDTVTNDTGVVPRSDNNSGTDEKLHENANKSPVRPGEDEDLEKVESSGQRLAKLNQSGTSDPSITAAAQVIVSTRRASHVTTRGQSARSGLGPTGTPIQRQTIPISELEHMSSPSGESLPDTPRNRRSSWTSSRDAQRRASMGSVVSDVSTSVRPVRSGARRSSLSSLDYAVTYKEPLVAGARTESRKTDENVYRPWSTVWSEPHLVPSLGRSNKIPGQSTLNEFSDHHLIASSERAKQVPFYFALSISSGFFGKKRRPRYCRITSDGVEIHKASSSVKLNSQWYSDSIKVKHADGSSSNAAIHFKERPYVPLVGPFSNDLLPLVTPQFSVISSASQAEVEFSLRNTRASGFKNVAQKVASASFQSLDSLYPWWRIARLDGPDLSKPDDESKQLKVFCFPVQYIRDLQEIQRLLIQRLRYESNECLSRIRTLREQWDLALRTPVEDILSMLAEKTVLCWAEKMAVNESSYGVTPPANFPQSSPEHKKTLQFDSVAAALSFKENYLREKESTILGPFYDSNKDLKEFFNDLNLIVDSDNWIQRESIPLVPPINADISGRRGQCFSPLWIHFTNSHLPNSSLTDLLPACFSLYGVSLKQMYVGNVDLLSKDMIKQDLVTSPTGYSRLPLLALDVIIRMRSCPNALVIVEVSDDCTIGGIALAAARRKKFETRKDQTGLTGVPLGSSSVHVLFLDNDEINEFVDTISHKLDANFNVTVPEIFIDDFEELYNVLSETEGRSWQCLEAKDGMTTKLGRLTNVGSFGTRLSTSKMLLMVSVVCDLLYGGDSSACNLYEVIRQQLTTTESNVDVMSCSLWNVLFNSGVRIPRVACTPTFGDVFEVDVGNGTFSQWSPFVQTVFEVYRVISSEIYSEGTQQLYNCAFACLAPHNVESLCGSVPFEQHSVLPTLTFSGERSSEDDSDGSEVFLAKVQPCLLCTTATHLLEFDITPLSSRQNVLVLRELIPLESVKALIGPDVTPVSVDTKAQSDTFAMDSFFGSQVGVQWSQDHYNHEDSALHFPLFHKANDFSTLSKSAQESMCKYCAKLTKTIIPSQNYGGSSYILPSGLWGKRTSAIDSHKAYATFSGFEDISCCGLFAENSASDFSHSDPLAMKEACDLLIDTIRSAQRRLGDMICSRSPVVMPISGNKIAAVSLQRQEHRPTENGNTKMQHSKALNTACYSSPHEMLSSAAEESDQICSDVLQEVNYVCCLADTCQSEWKLNGCRFLPATATLFDAHPVLKNFLEASNASVSSLRGGGCFLRSEALCVSRPLPSGCSALSKGAVATGVACLSPHLEDISQLSKSCEALRRTLASSSSAEQTSQTTSGNGIHLRTVCIIQEAGSLAPGLQNTCVLGNNADDEGVTFVSPVIPSSNMTYVDEFVGYTTSENHCDSVAYDSINKLLRSLQDVETMCDVSSTHNPSILTDLINDWENKIPSVAIVEEILDLVLRDYETIPEGFIHPIFRLLAVTCEHWRATCANSSSNQEAFKCSFGKSRLAQQSDLQQNYKMDLIRLLTSSNILTYASSWLSFFAMYSTSRTVDLIAKCFHILHRASLSLEGLDTVRKYLTKTLKQKNNFIERIRTVCHSSSGRMSAGPHVELFLFLRNFLCRSPTRSGQKLTKQGIGARDMDLCSVKTAEEDMLLDSKSWETYRLSCDTTLVGHSAAIQSHFLSKQDISKYELLMKSINLSEMFIEYIEAVISGKFGSPVAIGHAVFGLFVEGVCYKTSYGNDASLATVCFDHLLQNSEGFDPEKTLSLWNFLCAQISEYLDGCFLTDTLAAYCDFIVSMANYVYSKEDGPVLWARLQKRALDAGLMQKLLRTLLNPFVPVQSYACGRNSMLRLIRVLCRQSLRMKHLLYRLLPEGLLIHPIFRQIKNDMENVVGYASVTSLRSSIAWDHVDHGFAGQLSYSIESSRQGGTTSKIHVVDTSFQRMEGFLQWDRKSLPLWLTEQVHALCDTYMQLQPKDVVDIFNRGLRYSSLAKSSFAAEKHIPPGDCCSVVDWLSSPFNFCSSITPLWYQSWCFRTFDQVLNHLDSFEANQASGYDLVNCVSPACKIVDSFGNVSITSPLLVSEVNLLKLLKALLSGSERAYDLFEMLLGRPTVICSLLADSWQKYTALYWTRKTDEHEIRACIFKRRILLLWLRIAAQVMSWNDSSLELLDGSISRLVCVGGWHDHAFGGSLENDCALMSNCSARFSWTVKSDWSDDAVGSAQEVVASAGLDEGGTDNFLPCNHEGESLTDLLAHGNLSVRQALEAIISECSIPAGLVEMAISLHDTGVGNIFKLCYQNTQDETVNELPTLTFEMSSTADVLQFAYQIASWLWTNARDNLPTPINPHEKDLRKSLFRGSLPRSSLEGKILPHLESQQLPVLRRTVSNINSKDRGNLFEGDFERLKTQLIEICEQLLICDASMFSPGDMKQFICANGTTILLQLFNCAIFCSTLSPVLPTSAPTRFPKSGLASVTSISLGKAAQEVCVHSLHLINVILLIVTKFLSFAEFSNLGCSTETMNFINTICCEDDYSLIVGIAYVSFVHNETMNKARTSSKEVADMVAKASEQIKQFNDLSSSIFFRLMHICELYPQGCLDWSRSEGPQTLVKSLQLPAEDILAVASSYLQRYAPKEDTSSSEPSCGILSIRWGAIIYGCRCLKEVKASAPLPARSSLEDLLFFGCCWREIKGVSFIQKAIRLCKKVEAHILQSIQPLEPLGVNSQPSGPRRCSWTHSSSDVNRKGENSLRNETDSDYDGMPHRRRRRRPPVTSGTIPADRYNSPPDKATVHRSGASDSS